MGLRRGYVLLVKYHVAYVTIQVDATSVLFIVQGLHAYGPGCFAAAWAISVFRDVHVLYGLSSVRYGSVFVSSCGMYHCTFNLQRCLCISLSAPVTADITRYMTICLSYRL